MQGFILAVGWAGAIACGCLYWFKYSTTADNYVLRRYKTGFAMFLWPLFLVYLYLTRNSRRDAAANADAAKERILG